MKDPLRKKLDEVDGTLKELRTDAASKWQALDAAKTAVGDADGEITAESDVFVALDTAGKAYGEIADKITQTEQMKQRLIDSMVLQGIAAPEGAKHSGDDQKALDALGRELRKKAGDRIVEGEAYKQLVESGLLHSKSQLGVKQLGEGWSREEVKALITGASDTSAGAFVQADRVGFYPLPLRPLTVLDLITIGDTDSDLVEFVRTTSFTNAAAETAEATAVAGASGTKPESAMAFEIVQEGVSTIAHWVPATRRALADAGQLRTIIDGLLRYGLDRRLADQVIAGDGIGDNLTGILNTTGTNAVPAGAQSHADKVHKGITAIRLDDIEPTGVAIHPTDWETIRLSRENSGGDGGYLFGPPSVQGAETLWGKSVAVTASVPQGTAIVGDFRAYVLWMREGAQVLASDSHADFFVRNLIAILAELRAAGGIPYPQAFSEVNLAAA
jgi:HK97 family phage major capsid protein